MIAKPETEDLQEAKEIAREGVEKAKKFFQKEGEVKIGFGWSERNKVKERMNGARGIAYSSSYFEIDFNSNVEGWKTSLLGTSVHEYSHTYFYEIKEMNAKDEMPIWMYILSEALTLNTTEKLAPEAKAPWRKEHSKNEISEHWHKIKKEELDRAYSFPDPLFIDPEEEKYPNWLGYSLSYLIGKGLMKNYDLKDFPELGKEDVINAGDRIFGE